MREGSKNILEMMIDQYGLQAVLAALRDVCMEKAEHIRTNWQDKHLATAWGKAAIVCDNATAILPKVPGIVGTRS